MTEAKCVPEGRNYPSDEKAQLFNDMAPQSGASEVASDAQPTQQFRLPVSDLHELSVLEYGNPKGIPAVFLHGGPGAGVSAKQVASFDLDTYRVITFDQRGAGRSTPAAEIAENTTQHLIMDMETLREKLGIERWLVAGGSWGSCLGLAYGLAYPQRCLGFRLHGIFLGGQEDVDWWFYGCRAIFPDHWQKFAEFVPASERSDLLTAYYKRLTSGDSLQEQEAARSLRGFSARTQTFEPDTDHVSKLLKPEAALSVSRIFTHYCVNRAFLPDNYLIDNIDRIRHLPAEIVQARYDTVTPMMTAWKLKEAWPEANFTIVTLANHQSTIGPMADALAAASVRLARQLT
ncbi:prolyl aminopeptidase [Ochrobactrum sp. 695/2009]|nr:prolyl aminopeptidase [Ochrobactrum sp. 721/2009]PJT13694.1 prolyl aminopeptidase [Ochrobactrum sp. 720/2009]PJT18469.1 prolyl aminopeptidase [Ochrobactrum sp. 715/2009]PJT23826.1 prolyl aminopeptidase [Ochrobactrum sp. 695/2009]PJT33764.1 prolyl aminopeptidase [Ochrobactrum sp. 689/2009]